MTYSLGKQRENIHFVFWKKYLKWKKKIINLHPESRNGRVTNFFYDLFIILIYQIVDISFYCCIIVEALYWAANKGSVFLSWYLEFDGLFAHNHPLHDSCWHEALYMKTNLIVWLSDCLLLCFFGSLVLLPTGLGSVDSFITVRSTLQSLK